jgi:hypothetical protein
MRYYALGGALVAAGGLVALAGIALAVAWLLRRARRG